MKLVTDDLRRRLPPLGATSQQPDPIAICKFFAPDSAWTWYAMEFDGDDTFYGYVAGFDGEFGTFSLSELEELRGPLGMRVERDRHFEPTPFSRLEQ